MKNTLYKIIDKYENELVSMANVMIKDGLPVEVVKNIFELTYYKLENATLKSFIENNEIKKGDENDEE